LGVVDDLPESSREVLMGKDSTFRALFPINVLHLKAFGKVVVIESQNKVV
jgi:hypothetical protein